MIKEKAKCKGEYEITGRDEITGKILFIKRHNVIVQNFFTQVISALNGGTPVLNVTHFAVGTGTTTAMKADTALQTEIFRKAVSTTSVTSTKYIAKISIGASEAVATWGEVGMVINGTDTLASGSLLSHANLTFAKTATVQLLITFTLTIE